MARICKKTAHAEGVTFAFANGEIEDVLIGRFSEEIIGRLAIHGLSQKLGDSYAGVETVEEAVVNVKTLITQLSDGAWAVKVSTGGRLAEALARASGKALAECIEILAGKTKEEKATLRKHPAVAAALAQLELEAAEKKLALRDGEDIPELVL